MSFLRILGAFLLAVSIPYIVLHHVYPNLRRGVGGVARASVAIVVAEYNEVSRNEALSYPPK